MKPKSVIFVPNLCTGCVVKTKGCTKWCPYDTSVETKIKQRTNK